MKRKTGKIAANHRIKGNVCVCVYNRERELILIIGHGFDVEAKSRADNTGVFAIDFQYDCCLPRIIKSTVDSMMNYTNTKKRIIVLGEKTITYTIRMRISFSFLLIFRMMLRSPILGEKPSQERIGGNQMARIAVAEKNPDAEDRRGFNRS